MTTDTGYTPTTTEVQTLYEVGRDEADGAWREDTAAEFQRWLARVQAEAQVKALRELSDELNERRANHDVAECAAFVEGEVGRQTAIDSWIEICEEPDKFVAEYTRRIAREAGVDSRGRELMDIIYDDWTLDSELEFGNLNGRDGAVFLTLGDGEELDITFESVTGLIEWATDVIEKASSLAREAGIEQDDEG